MTLTPYQRIMRAAERGAGVRLSADEVFDLSLDEAIRMAAINDDHPEDAVPTFARIGDELEAPGTTDSEEPTR